MRVCVPKGTRTRTPRGVAESKPFGGRYSNKRRNGVGRAISRIGSIRGQFESGGNAGRAADFYAVMLAHAPSSGTMRGLNASNFNQYAVPGTRSGGGIRAIEALQ